MRAQNLLVVFALALVLFGADQANAGCLTAGANCIPGTFQGQQEGKQRGRGPNYCCYPLVCGPSNLNPQVGGKNYEEFKCKSARRRSLLEVLDDDNYIVGDVGNADLKLFDEDI